MKPYKVFFVIILTLLPSIFGSCSDDNGELAAPTPATEIDTVIAGTAGDGWIGPYWPRLINGDCEFGDKGPVVTLKADLYSEQADLLMCDVYMRAEETERNWSAAEESWHEVLYQAPSGWHIVDIGIDPSFCHVQYIDSNYEEDVNNCDGFVFRSKGDVSGDDIVCGRTPDYNMSYVRVWIDTLYVEIERN
jgi:hypothetical protein